ncbi:Leucine-rich repeat (LRR) family protein [Abeliophyllum distichum]|uniref:Leucine-rich repeat (LRR) family protein n=1 Tax=Abeliophyllum distichum TaxID=126358 RepID=A0ABD1P8S9_9LAMI
MSEPKSSIFIFLLFISSLLYVHSFTFSSDIISLQAFKSSIKPASIPHNSCLATWNFSTDPCSIPRVTHFTCGITCSSGRVVQLTLDSQGYSGTLTPLISNLTRLVTLDLTENNFYGPIPLSISSLPNLQNLILRVNSFSGVVPPSVTSLKSLEFLDLSQNSLSGSLPNSMNSLTSLTRLDLSYNNLTGSLPKLPPNLNELALKANSLSGSLFYSSFDGLTQLMVVELGENSFRGTLDAWLFLLPSLQQIDLANNSFTRIIVPKPPTNFNSQLVAVNLSFNRINGFLPANFVYYPTLRSLGLSYNQLRGPIPKEYSKKGSLQRLFLDGNFLNGSPPSDFFSGDTTVSGSLGDNCLKSCPVSSQFCLKSQKPASICQQAYGGKPSS